MKKFKRINTEFIHTKIAKQEVIDKILNNKYFKDKITSFNLSKNEIEKHLSFISKCIQEYDLMKECNDKICKSTFNGYWNDFKIIDQKIYHTIIPCKCLIEKQGKWINLKNENLVYFSKELQNITLNDLDISNLSREKIKIYFQNFIKNFPKPIKGLYLLGNSGWGKTFALAAFANTIFEKEKNIMLLDCKTNFQELRDLASKELFKIIREKFKTAKILIIDGLGEEMQNTFNRDYVLFPILEYRFKHKKHTIFSSRYKYEELEKKYSKDNSFIESKKLLDIIRAQSIPVIISKIKK